MDFKKGSIDGVDYIPRKQFNDSRGWLIETFRMDELGPDFSPVMGYTSMTLPGIVRGPHEHKEQADFFVFFGPGNFKVWLWDNRKKSPTYGNKQELVLGADNPAQLLVPPGVVHAYQNIGTEPAVGHNFPNRLYGGNRRREPVDEIRHENDPNSPFKID